jgi:fibro-slime domain-containing protein
MFNKRWADGELVTDESLGDQAGTAGVSNTGGVESADSFGQWYRDEMGVNLSRPLTLTLVRQEDGSYVFDDKEDPAYSANGGFFPIDDEMLGNPGGTPDHNFHFTFELHMAFEYDADGDQFFKFKGDDDVWVFIDDKLVIDLGGVHGVQTQHVSLPSRSGGRRGVQHRLLLRRAPSSALQLQAGDEHPGAQHAAADRDRGVRLNFP